MPDEISRQPAVSSRARKIGYPAGEMLLDRSYHHAAMKRLEKSGKRGRPDIVHYALMESLSTPLFIHGHLDVYVHTIGDRIISLASGLRIPKSYFRFEGLMQNLFRDGTVRSNDNIVLMEMKRGNLRDLIDDVRPGKVVGLSSAGVQSSAEKVVRKYNLDKCMFVIGGFPKGHFEDETQALFNCTYSIEDIGLEAHVVIARILYECERMMIANRAV